MRKNLLLLLLMAISVCSLQAQEPTTTWPYLYNNFMQGKVFFKDGSNKDYMVNVHILNSKLHYLEGENIKEAKSSDVVLVQVGTAVFYSKQGKIMKVVAEQENGFVGEVVLADMAALNSDGGAAYGASANSTATRKLSSIDAGGPSASTNHMNMLNEKDNGILVPMEKEYYIVTNGEVFPANKKEFELLLPVDKKGGLKAFLKANKISWKDPASLVKLIDYINL